MSFVKRLVVILVVLISCVGCDQVTKSIAKSALSDLQARSFLADTVRLQLAYNEGALLSLGASLPKAWRQGIFIIGVGLVLLGTLVFAFAVRPGYLSAVAAVALIFSGGVSNLIDRIVTSGSVVDFLNVGIGPVRTGIFNVADVIIAIGVLMLFSTLFGRRKRVEAADGRLSSNR